MVRVGYAGNGAAVVFRDDEGGKMRSEAESVGSNSSSSRTRWFEGSYSRIEAAEGHCPHVVGEVGDGRNERENAGKSLVQDGGLKKVENLPCAVV